MTPGPRQTRSSHHSAPGARGSCCPLFLLLSKPFFWAVKATGLHVRLSPPTCDRGRGCTCPRGPCALPPRVSGAWVNAVSWWWRLSARPHGFRDGQREHEVFLPGCCGVSRPRGVTLCSDVHVLPHKHSERAGSGAPRSTALWPPRRYVGAPHACPRFPGCCVPERGGGTCPAQGAPRTGAGKGLAHQTPHRGPEQLTEPAVTSPQRDGPPRWRPPDP